MGSVLSPWVGPLKHALMRRLGKLFCCFWHSCGQSALVTLVLRSPGGLNAHKGGFMKDPKKGSRSEHTKIANHNCSDFPSQVRKTREGCGCPKFAAGKAFRQSSTLLENNSPVFRQHEMLSLPRFGHFPARKVAAGKSVSPLGTLLEIAVILACGGVSQSQSQKIAPFRRTQLKVHLFCSLCRAQRRVVLAPF